MLGRLNAPVDLSYLADNVIVLRYFEHAGEVHKGISMLKRRAGGHEETIRELRMVTGEGIRVGEPLRGFQNIMSGIPLYVGSIKDSRGNSGDPA
jgi:circadian clock protein KaiC